MAKTISFEYEGKTYTLEYTRASVQQMEKNGFSLDEIDSKPTVMMPMLFAGAFLAHHKFAKPEVISQIFDRMSGKAQLYEKLVVMYNDTVNSLIDEPEDDAKNVSWNASW